MAIYPLIIYRLDNSVSAIKDTKSRKVYIPRKSETKCSITSFTIGGGGLLRRAGARWWGYIRERKGDRAYVEGKGETGVGEEGEEKPGRKY